MKVEMKKTRVLQRSILLMCMALVMVVSVSSGKEKKKPVRQLFSELRAAKTDEVRDAVKKEMDEYVPETEAEIKELGEELDKTDLIVQAQKIMARTGEPKLSVAITEICKVQTGKLKAKNDKDWEKVTLTDEEKRTQLNSLLNTQLLIGVLGRLKNKDAIPFLKTYLEYDGQLSWAASEALSGMGDEALVDELMQKMDEGKSINLAVYGEIALVKMLKKLDEKGTSEKTKGKIADQISGMGGRDKKEKDLLKELVMKHPDVGIRQMAGIAVCHSMLNRQDPDDFDFLMEWSKDLNGPGTWDSLTCIRIRWDKRFVPVVIRYLREAGSSSVRTEAARLLGSKKVVEAVPYLEEALKNGPVNERSAACSALENITGKEYFIEVTEEEMRRNPVKLQMIKDGKLPKYRIRK